MIQLSKQQEAAFAAVKAWFEDPNAPQTFRLFGYAGTGKTSIAKQLVEALGIDREDYRFAAYTGKAASVLRSKGCEPASTVHGLIYKFNGTDHEGKPEFDTCYKKTVGLRLAILDECSMIGRRMGADLEAMGCKILVLGDPAQLPPIGDSGYFTDSFPDVLLTEIHRQAADSGILQLATAAREGKPLPEGLADAVVAPQPTWPMIDGHDIVLCGTHARRNGINDAVRKRRGFTAPVEVGDRLVCTRNNHLHGVMNGETGTVREIAAHMDDFGEAVLVVGLDSGKVVTTVSTLANSVGDHHSFEGSQNVVCWDYGYAITVHKAQGSQWDSVLLVNESRVFGVNAKQWLYTGITRAAKHLTVVP